MKTFLITFGILMGVALTPLRSVFAEDHFVYNIFKPLMMGYPGEKDYRDFYLTLGSANGIKSGTKLEVYRKLSTYDQVNRSVLQDVMIPIAEIRVIHVEDRVSIARLEKMKVLDEIPAVQPFSVMIGDLVRRP